MSEPTASKSPKKSGSGGHKLDHFTVVYEIAIALEKGEGKLDWNSLAQTVGSASGGAAQKAWQYIKKKKEAEKAGGEKSPEKGAETGNSVLKPKASKVEKKPRTPKKAATSKDSTPKAKDTTSPAKSPKATTKTPSPKKKGGKGAKKELVDEEAAGPNSPADSTMISGDELDEIKNEGDIEE